MVKRVLIINRNSAVAFGLVCLCKRAGLDVAGVASDIDAALDLAVAARPDIGLVGAEFAQAPELQRLIRSNAGTACRFLMTSGRSDPPPHPAGFPFEWAPLSDEAILEMLQKAKAEAPPALRLQPAA